MDPGIALRGINTLEEEIADSIAIVRILGILMGFSDWSRWRFLRSEFTECCRKVSRNERMKSVSAWRWAPTRAT